MGGELVLCFTFRHKSDYELSATASSKNESTLGRMVLTDIIEVARAWRIKSLAEVEPIEFTLYSFPFPLQFSRETCIPAEGET